MCGRYLLEGQLSYRELTFGEAAHIVGSKATNKSPRGLEGDLGEDARDNADNLILMCDDEHSEIDKIGSRDAFAVTFLRELKRKHEDRIRLAHKFRRVSTHHPHPPIGACARQSLQRRHDPLWPPVHGKRQPMPHFDLSTRNTIEIDLRRIAGEDTAQYYESAKAAIDQVIDHKVAEAISNEDIMHLSVFALARLPLLVYLGAKLDDTVPIDIYQKHRSAEDLAVAARQQLTRFQCETCAAGRPHRRSSSNHQCQRHNPRSELPSSTSHLARYEITVGEVPHPDILQSAAALADFTAAGRHLLARLEADGHKHIRLLHVFAAMPLSAAVAFGRIFADEVHPALQLYDRTQNGVYTPAIQVGQQ